ncbi:hypothetical protein HF521_016950 [Silurus meridionalis]|uniref:Uncharacterized protein n=1 Tax=Silurus meridionalis TaxID=175797 RepID=A0A8T0BNK9_SILME|nr:hypothetical protein HF521_016950 [Silurus meridionalis]
MEEIISEAGRSRKPTLPVGNVFSVPMPLQIPLRDASHCLFVSSDTGRWRQDTASVSSKQLVPCEDSVSSKQLVPCEDSASSKQLVLCEDSVSSKQLVLCEDSVSSSSSSPVRTRSPPSSSSPVRTRSLQAARPL